MGMPYPGVVMGTVPSSRPQIANVQGENVGSPPKLLEGGKGGEMRHLSAGVAPPGLPEGE